MMRGQRPPCWQHDDRVTWYWQGRLCLPDWWELLAVAVCNTNWGLIRRREKRGELGPGSENHGTGITGPGGQHHTARGFSETIIEFVTLCYMLHSNSIKNCVKKSFFVYWWLRLDILYFYHIRFNESNHWSFWILHFEWRWKYVLCRHIHVRM